MFKSEKILNKSVENVNNLLVIMSGKWYTERRVFFNQFPNDAEKEQAIMDVCYNKLFKLLIDKGMKRSELKKKVGLSQGTLAKLSKNETVSMDVIVRICRTLDCTVDEILDIVPSPDNGTADDVQS